LQDIENAEHNLCHPRPAPRKKAPILGTRTAVLQLTGQPMRVGEIHAAAEALLGNR